MRRLLLSGLLLVPMALQGQFVFEQSRQPRAEFGKVAFRDSETGDPPYITVQLGCGAPNTADSLTVSILPNEDIWEIWLRQPDGTRVRQQTDLSLVFPMAEYKTGDLDGNGLKDVAFTFDPGGNGLMGQFRYRLYVFQTSAGQFKAVTAQTFLTNETDSLDYGRNFEYDLNADGRFEFVFRTHHYREGKSYWVFNAYHWHAGRGWENVSKQMGWPLVVRHLNRANFAAIPLSASERDSWLVAQPEVTGNEYE